MKLGTKDIAALKVGSVNASKAYLGSTLVWEAGAGPSPSAPEVIATSTGAEASATDEHVVTLPEGVATGDLLVLFMRLQNVREPSPPSGWSALVDFGGFGNHLVYYRVADGSEGATITVNIPVSSVRSAWVAYCVRGAAVGSLAFIEAGTAESLDAPELTPSWGAAENLWLVSAGRRRTDNTLTAPPTYGGQLEAETSSGSSSTLQVRIATAHKISASASDDPDEWGSTGSLNGPTSLVVAVRPA